MSYIEKSKALKQAADKLHDELAGIAPFDLNRSCAAVLNFSSANEQLASLEVGDTKALEEFVWGEISAAHAEFGIGGYAEERAWYQRSPLFDSPDGPRIVHLGIDLWAKPGTPLFAPLSGRVHSLRDNANFGDYGPTIVLEHELGGVGFFSIWGHLSRESLLGKHRGQRIEAGMPVAHIGNPPSNGDWPPHLHFQLTLDMLGNEGDFPGVAALAKKDFFLSVCPDPNILLRVSALRS